MKLSIIIPCFNFKDRIFNIYDNLKESFKNIKYELIFIDYMSDDETVDKLKDLYSNDMRHIKIIILERIYNIDEIYKLGIKNSSGEHICLYDYNVSIDEIYEMYNLITNDNYDVVIYQYNIENNSLLNLLYNIGDRICSTNLEKMSNNCRIFNTRVKEYFIKYCDYYSNLKQIFNLMGFKTNYFKGKYSCAKRIIVKRAIKDIDNYLKDVKKILFWKEFILGFILLIASFIYLIFIIGSGNIDIMYFLIFIIILFDSLLIMLVTRIGNNLTKQHSSNYNTICIINEKIGFEDKGLL